MVGMLRFALTMCALSWSLAAASPVGAARRPDDTLARAVRDAVTPVMQANGIPGMSVAITRDGHARVFHFGVASRESRVPVNERTLFEVGSVSKTFTATLASWAVERGKLAWDDPVSRHLPALKGSSFGDVRVKHLATHTPGGLPLQVPDEVRDDQQLLQWFARWKPEYAPGTQRTYGNPGIGALGFVAANSLGGDFVTLVERDLLPALGMPNTFLNVPAERRADYAQGYDSEDSLARLSPGVIWAPAYGIHTTAADLIRYVELNMGEHRVAPPWQRALAATHTGFYAVGPMTQDVAWEQYAYPVALDTLLAGNSPQMAFEPHAATELRPPAAPRGDVWINKTGATRGFSAYVAFVPARRIGVVVLANKSCSSADRIKVAYAIMRALEGRAR